MTSEKIRKWKSLISKSVVWYAVHLRIKCQDSNGKRILRPFDNTWSLSATAVQSTYEWHFTKFHSSLPGYRPRWEPLRSVLFVLTHTSWGRTMQIVHIEKRSVIEYHHFWPFLSSLCPVNLSSKVADDADLTETRFTIMNGCARRWNKSPNGLFLFLPIARATKSSSPFVSRPYAYRPISRVKFFSLLFSHEKNI